MLENYLFISSFSSKFCIRIFNSINIIVNLIINGSNFFITLKILRILELLNIFCLSSLILNSDLKMRIKIDFEEKKKIKITYFLYFFLRTTIATITTLEILEIMMIPL